MAGAVWRRAVWRRWPRAKEELLVLQLVQASNMRHGAGQRRLLLRLGKVVEATDLSPGGLAHEAVAVHKVLVQGVV